MTKNLLIILLLLSVSISVNAQAAFPMDVPPSKATESNSSNSVREQNKPSKPQNPQKHTHPTTPPKSTSTTTPKSTSTNAHKPKTQPSHNLNKDQNSQYGSNSSKTQVSNAVSSSKHIPQVIQNLITNMVFVEGGTFNMGATQEQGSGVWDREKPYHIVTIGSFSICRYEVTQEEWKAVMGSNPSHFKGDKLPVEQVSWNDCQTFISRLNQMTGKNFRLPTEAEWEFAARGGKKSEHCQYSGSNNVSNVGWYKDNSGSTTHHVGQKSPNELGLYDMSGNVWEWCADIYGPYSSSAQTNPKGASNGSIHVFRGGSWNNNANTNRVSFRNNSPSAVGSYYLGLRLAL